MKYFNYLIKAIIVLSIFASIFSCNNNKSENKEQKSSLVIYSPASRDFIDPLIEK